MKVLTSCLGVLLTAILSSSPQSATLERDDPTSSQEETSLVSFGGDFGLALDNYRSLPEGSWEGNMGAFFSGNFKMMLPMSFLFQVGGSYGLYNWDGRASAPLNNTNMLQQQGFITTALSRETSSFSGVNFGVAYDWMLNKSLGVFAVNPFISQVRAQLGYLIHGNNEIGAWATINTNTSHKTSENMPIKFRAVSQANIFWTYHFQNKAFTTLWAGTPYRRGLMYSSGRAGTYLVGTRFQAPLTNRLNIFGHGMYMGSRKSLSSSTSKNYAADVCFGIAYAFGKGVVKDSSYVSIANNSNFIIDTNANY